MILDVFEFSSIYVFLCIILLLSIIYSKLLWWFKSIIIISSLVFFILSYNTVTNLAGRPTKSDLPKDFGFVGHIVEEPNKRTNDPGRIILLIKDEIDFRLYELPYSEELHKQLQKAAEAQKKGGNIKAKATKVAGEKYRYKIDFMIQNKFPELPPKESP